MSFARYERHDAIGIVTLDRPERLNAISGGLLGDLSVALRAGIVDVDAAVLIVTGAGRAFCAGDDLKEFDLQSSSAAAIRSHIVAIQDITRLIMGCDKLIIGAVHGYAVGGGFEWMLNCDLVVAADDLVAFFPEMDWGQFVTGGVTHLLPQAIGYQRAMELLVLGERQTAARLEQLNLVNAVVPHASMLNRAMAMARIVATKSRFSVGRLKTMLNGASFGQRLWQAVEQEEAITIESFAQPDVARRVAGFVARKRGG
jgi:enoyl-CoA hydratase/carnithine racemase